LPHEKASPVRVAPSVLPGVWRRGAACSALPSSPLLCSDWSCVPAPSRAGPECAHCRRPPVLRADPGAPCRSCGAGPSWPRPIPREPAVWRCSPGGATGCRQRCAEALLGCCIVVVRGASGP